MKFLPRLVSSRPSVESHAGLTAEAWDAEVAAHGGSVLQSWRWGEFKTSYGWRVERVRIERSGKVALAQVLFRSYGPVTIAYLPRGPVVPEDASLTLDLLTRIDAVCKRRRCVFLMIEPDGALPVRACIEELGFVPGPHPFQPIRTVKVPLGDDERILAGMRRDTRANVRRAMREGVELERAAVTSASVSRMYALLDETAERNAFHIHDAAYYGDVLRQFGDDALLAFARVGNMDAVGLIAVRHGAEAVYLYGGSSAIHRIRGAAPLLQFEAMRWARERGCASYDLWGIPAVDPPTVDVAKGRVATTHGERWDGLYQFKTGFGGEIVSYPAALERRYRPVLAWLARRRYPRYRPAPAQPDVTTSVPAPAT